MLIHTLALEIFVLCEMSAALHLDGEFPLKFLLSLKLAPVVNAKKKERERFDCWYRGVSFFFHIAFLALLRQYFNQQSVLRATLKEI